MNDIFSLWLEQKRAVSAWTFSGPVMYSASTPIAVAFYDDKFIITTLEHAPQVSRVAFTKEFNIYTTTLVNIKTVASLFEYELYAENNNVLDEANRGILHQGSKIETVLSVLTDSLCPIPAIFNEIAEINDNTVVLYRRLFSLEKHSI